MPGGNPVVILLKPEKFDKEKVYFIAMKAYDDSKMDSGVSNFGQIYRFDKPEDTGHKRDRTEPAWGSLYS